MLNYPRCFSVDRVKSGVINERQRYKCKAYKKKVDRFIFSVGESLGPVWAPKRGRVFPAAVLPGFGGNP